MDRINKPYVVSRWTLTMYEARNHGMYARSNLFKRFDTREEAELFLMLLKLEGDRVWENQNCT